MGEKSSGLSLLPQKICSTQKKSEKTTPPVMRMADTGTIKSVLFYLFRSTPQRLCFLAINHNTLCIRVRI